MMERPKAKEYSQKDKHGKLDHVDRRSYCFGLNQYIDHLESKLKNLGDIGDQIYIHIKTGNEYIIINDSSQIKANGEWFPAVVYQRVGVCSNSFYIREVEQFNIKFKLKGDEC